jgi:hypothetical protein
MSNRIDLFQVAQTALTLPAMTVAIFVDGTMCPILETKEIIRDTWPDFSRARLEYNPVQAVENNISDFLDIEKLFPMGKSLSVKAFYSGTLAGNSKTSNYSIFEGQIEKIETTLQSNNQSVEIIARDFSAAMERITVYGQRITKDSGTIFLNGFDTVFNPDGKANASDMPVDIHGRSYKIFSADTQNAKLWKYAEVIHYLLSEYVTIDQLHVPCLQRLLSITDKQIVRDLNVTGLSLVDALHRCCQRIGINFTFIPVDENYMSSQAIVFNKASTGRTVELNCQKSGQVSISKTNVTALRSQKNYWPNTHRFIGQGDYKIYEATFELIKTWDSSLEANTYHYFSPSTYADFYKVRDVYRKWTLNEAGDYSGLPYSRGDAFDFSTIFGVSNYVHKRRRFWPCLTTDSQNRSLGYYLQISYDDGLTWRQYEDAFNILTDECGIWLSSDQLNIDLILASAANKLRFRITASVISDERLITVAASGPVNSITPVIDHVVTLPRQFKYQKVSDRSIFAHSQDDIPGISDEIDDTNALYEFVRHLSYDSPEVIETIDFQTLVPVFDYRLGDIVVSSPESRDIFSCRNRSISHIENVHIDFQKQCTNLKVIRKKRYEK